MASPPTIRMLAQAAGVSKATVSLALRDSPRIRPAVRERIQRLAAESGYRPNALVANLLAQLRASKTSTFQSTLGLLCVAKDQSVLQEVPTFRSWVAGCRARAAELGYGFDQFWVHEPGISPARLVEILDARNIRGVAVFGFLDGGSISRKFDPIWRRTAAVALGTRPTRPALHFASNDQYVTAAQAVRELIRLGYQRPGLCVNGHIDDIVENKFTGGFWVAQCRLPPAQRLPVFDFQPDARERFRALAAPAPPGCDRHRACVHPRMGGGPGSGRAGRHCPRASRQNFRFQGLGGHGAEQRNHRPCGDGHGHRPAPPQRVRRACFPEVHAHQQHLESGHHRAPPGPPPDAATSPGGPGRRGPAPPTRKRSNAVALDGQAGYYDYVCHRRRVMSSSFSATLPRLPPFS